MPNAPPKASLQGAICLVDPDQSARVSLARSLAQFGMKIEQFDSAEPLLLRAGRIMPLCLIADVSLPGISAIELFERLKQRYDRAVPTIFVSGHADVQDAVRAMQAGALDYLLKPYIHASIHRHLSMILAEGGVAAPLSRPPPAVSCVASN